MLHYVFRIFLAFCFLYTSSLWTFTRGMNVSLVFALYGIPFYNHKHSTVVTLCIFIFLSISFVCVFKFETIPSHTNSTESFVKYENVFKEHFSVEKNADEWRNTCAHYGYCYNEFLYWPAGLSSNYMLNGQIESRAKYTIIDKQYSEYARLVDEYYDAGYKMTYVDELFCILEKE